MTFLAVITPELPRPRPVDHAQVTRYLRLLLAHNKQRMRSMTSHSLMTSSASDCAASSRPPVAPDQRNLTALKPSAPVVSSTRSLSGSTSDVIAADQSLIVRSRHTARGVSFSGTAAKPRASSAPDTVEVLMCGDVMPGLISPDATCTCTCR